MESVLEEENKYTSQHLIEVHCQILQKQRYATNQVWKWMTECTFDSSSNKRIPIHSITHRI